MDGDKDEPRLSLKPRGPDIGLYSRQAGALLFSQFGKTLAPENWFVLINPILEHFNLLVCVSALLRFSTWAQMSRPKSPSVFIRVPPPPQVTVRQSRAGSERYRSVSPTERKLKVTPVISPAFACSRRADINGPYPIRISRASDFTARAVPPSPRPASPSWKTRKRSGRTVLHLAVCSSAPIIGFLSPSARSWLKQCLSEPRLQIKCFFGRARV